jgi:hypothetical protein
MSGDRASVRELTYAITGSDDMPAAAATNAIRICRPFRRLGRRSLH